MRISLVECELTGLNRGIVKRLISKVSSMTSRKNSGHPSTFRAHFGSYRCYSLLQVGIDTHALEHSVTKERWNDNNYSIHDNLQISMNKLSAHQYRFHATVSGLAITFSVQETEHCYFRGSSEEYQGSKRESQRSRGEQNNLYAVPDASRYQKKAIDQVAAIPYVSMYGKSRSL